MKRRFPWDIYRSGSATADAAIEAATVEFKTDTINFIRAHLAEFGIVAPVEH